MANAAPKSLYMKELVVQQRMLVAILVLLCAGSFGIRFDRAWALQQPAAFLADARQPAPFVLALASRVPAGRSGVGRRGARVPTVRQIFTDPATAAGTPADVAASPGTVGPQDAAPTPIDVPAAARQLGSGSFIGLPGGGGGGTNVTPGTPGTPGTPDPGPPAVPEPETWLLLAIGLAFVGFLVRKQARAAALQLQG